MSSYTPGLAVPTAGHRSRHEYRWRHHFEGNSLAPVEYLDTHYFDFLVGGWPIEIKPDDPAMVGEAAARVPPDTSIIILAGRPGYEVRYGARRVATGEVELRCDGQMFTPADLPAHWEELRAKWRRGDLMAGRWLPLEDICRYHDSPLRRVLASKYPTSELTELHNGRRNFAWVLFVDWMRWFAWSFPHLKGLL